MDLDSGRWAGLPGPNVQVFIFWRETHVQVGRPVSGSCQRCPGEGVLSSDVATKRPPEAHKPVRTTWPALRCYNGWHFPAGSKDTNRSGLCRTCPAHSPQPNLQNTGLFIKSPPRRGEGPCRASPFSVRTPARADCPLPVHLCGDRESVQFTCLRCRKWISSGGLWERPGGARCLPCLDVDFSPSMAFSEFP